jgi:hypothetical protein
MNNNDLNAIPADVALDFLAEILPFKDLEADRIAEALQAMAPTEYSSQKKFIILQIILNSSNKLKK